MGAPQTLPANFAGWDKAPAAPATLPADFANWDKPKAAAPPVPSGFWDTLTREGKSMTGTIAGMPAAVYHAFSEPATAEEAEKFGGKDQVSGAKRVGLGLHRLLTAPVENAVDWYSDALKGKIPNAYEQALSVAPEAVGSGAGSVLASEIAAKAPAAVSAAADAARDIPLSKVTAPVRAAVRGANTVLAKAPGSIGASAGAALGHATGVPGASEIGAAAGYALGKEILPQVRIPGEGFGFPNRVTGGPPTIPSEVEPPASPAAPAAQQPPAAAPAASTPETAAPAERTLSELSGSGIPRTLSGESALRQVLTGQDTPNLMKIAKSRGINVTQESQLKPSIAGPRLVKKIVDDFSDDELDDLRDQYLENTRMGKHDFGDIGPEAWKTMSLKTYFPDVKIPASVEIRTARAIADASTKSAAPTGSTVTDLAAQLKKAAKTAKPKAAAPAATGALEDQLTDMLNQVKKGKKLSDLAAQ